MNLEKSDQELIYRKLIKQFKRYVQPNTNIYDLGCGTGELLIEIHNLLDDIDIDDLSVSLIGIDSEQSLIDIARDNKVNSNISDRYIHFERLKIEDETTIIENASIVILSNTLQKINPIHRQNIIDKIYKGLTPDGILLLVESVIPETSLLEDLYDPRTNKYIPYKVSENLELLRVYAQEVFIQIEDVVGLIAWKQSFNPYQLFTLAQMEMKGMIEKSLFINQALNTDINLLYKDKNRWKDGLSAISENYDNITLEQHVGGEPMENQTDDDFKNKHRFDYDWKRNDNWFKNRMNVFSTFSSGGGSSYGYKLAGVNVLANLELQKKYHETYLLNHSVKYPFNESIVDFNKKPLTAIPSELFGIDILDGSPPCTKFSMSGKRENDWEKELSYAPGYAPQRTEELFFDFLHLAKRLQSKTIIAENVVGLSTGKAKPFFVRILAAFDRAGYYVNYYLQNAQELGVPQSRPRLFFIAVRKDLAKHIKKSIKDNIPIDYLKGINLNNADSIDIKQFHISPLPKLEFKAEGLITYKDIEELNPDPSDYKKITDPKKRLQYDKVMPGKTWDTLNIKGNAKIKKENIERKKKGLEPLKEKVSGFSTSKLDPNKPVPTIMMGNIKYHHEIKRELTAKELLKVGSWPSDYNFNGLNLQHLIGESVPPVMMAHIATAVVEQYLLPINKAEYNIIPTKPKSKVSAKKTKTKKVTAKAKTKTVIASTTPTIAGSLYNQVVKAFDVFKKTFKYTTFPNAPSHITADKYTHWFYKYAPIKKNMEKYKADDAKHKAAISIIGGALSSPDKMEALKNVYALRKAKKSSNTSSKPSKPATPSKKKS